MAAIIPQVRHAPCGRSPIENRKIRPGPFDRSLYQSSRTPFPLFRQARLQKVLIRSTCSHRAEKVWMSGLPLPPRRQLGFCW